MREIFEDFKKELRDRTDSLIKRRTNNRNNIDNPPIELVEYLNELMVLIDDSTSGVALWHDVKGLSERMTPGIWKRLWNLVFSKIVTDLSIELIAILAANSLNELRIEDKQFSINKSGANNINSSQQEPTNIEELTQAMREVSNLNSLINSQLIEKDKQIESLTEELNRWEREAWEHKAEQAELIQENQIGTMARVHQIRAYEKKDAEVKRLELRVKELEETIFKTTENAKAVLDDIKQKAREQTLEEMKPEIDRQNEEHKKEIEQVKKECNEQISKMHQDAHNMFAEFLRSQAEQDVERDKKLQEQNEKLANDLRECMQHIEQKKEEINELKASCREKDQQLAGQAETIDRQKKSIDDLTTKLTEKEQAVIRRTEENMVLRNELTEKNQQIAQLIEVDKSVNNRRKKHTVNTNQSIATPKGQKSRKIAFWQLIDLATSNDIYEKNIKQKQLKHGYQRS